MTASYSRGSLVFIILLSVALWGQGAAPTRRERAAVALPAAAPGRQALLVPIAFMPAGTAPGAAPAFTLRAGALAGRVTPAGIELETNARHASLAWVGANHRLQLAPEGAPSGRANFLLGNDRSRWMRDLPLYPRVSYIGLYPGISAVLYGNGRSLEQDFQVAPGADPTAIAFRLPDATRITRLPGGGLRIELPGGSFVLGAPLAYQETGGRREPVPARYLVARDDTIRLRVGRYDRHRRLTIDPTLTFATYLDTSGSEAVAVATDSTGATYVAGDATSTQYPVTADAFQTTCTDGCGMVFVTKLNSAGTAQVYSTFLGGTLGPAGDNNNQASGLAVDAAGDAIITGTTMTTDFPLLHSAGTPSTKINGTSGFVTSLNPNGDGLNYSSAFGETDCAAVAVDGLGNAYVTGDTGLPSFPVTDGALDAATPDNAKSVGYIAKFTPAGTLSYSAMLGLTIGEPPAVSAANGLTAIAVDASGAAFVTGGVGPTWPVTSGAYAGPSEQDMGSVVVTKLHPDGSKLDFSAAIATGNGAAIAVGPDDQPVIAGNLTAETLDTSPNAFDTAATGGFVVRLSADGSQLNAATYFPAYLSTVQLDAAQNVWLGGRATSGFSVVLPLAANGSGGMVAELSPDLSTAQFATYMGDSGNVAQIAIDASGNVHVAGEAAPGMYTTPGAFRSSPPPSSLVISYPYAAIIAKVPAGPAVCGLTAIPFDTVQINTTSTKTVTLTNCGNAALTVASVSISGTGFALTPDGNGCTLPVAPQATCSLQVAFTPTGNQTSYTGTLVVASNAGIPTASAPLSGAGGLPDAVVANTPQFQPALVGQSQSDWVTLQNQGEASLTINAGAAVITGDFAITTNTCAAALHTNAECGVELTFTPTAAGERTGTLTIPTSDPNHPTLTVNLSGTGYSAYPVPVATTLTTPSFPINQGLQTTTVTGANFFPGSQVELNGVAQSTSYLTSTSLSVNLDTSLLSYTSPTPLTVVNPAPGGGASAPVGVIGYLVLPISASALAYDAANGMLYAAISASATQNPNTVVAINPATGQVGTPVAVASNPTKLAISSDGTELYVGADATLQRYSLPGLTLERSFPLPTDNLGQTAVADMQVVPGLPQSVVAALFTSSSPSEAGVALFNDSGLVNLLPAQGSNTTDDLYVDSVAFAGSPSLVYGALDEGQGYSFFATLGVSSSGLTNPGTPQSDQAVAGPKGNLVRSDGTNLFTDWGQVFSPSSHALLGTFPDPGDSQGDMLATDVLPDAASGNTYFLNSAAIYENEQASSVEIYNTAAMAWTGSIAFQPNGGFSGFADLRRWGSDGIAFRGLAIPIAAAGAVIILANSLTGPGSAAIASLSTHALTFDAQTVGTASAAQTITLKNPGSAPLSLASVEASGDYAVTDDCGVSLAPGAACTLAITFAPTVVGSRGGTLTITDNATGSPQIATLVGTSISPAPGATFSAASIAFGSQLTDSTSAAQTVTLTNTGVQTLTITGMSITAGFAQTNTCGAGVAAGGNCTIAVTFAPAATGSQSGTLSVTDNAASGSQTLILTGTGSDLDITPASGSASSATVAPGASTAYALIFTPVSGATGTFNLTCTGAPAGATCTPSPAGITLSDPGAISVSINVTTTASSGLAPGFKSRPRPPWLPWLALLLVIPAGLILTRRRRLALLGLAGICLLAGCGGGAGSPGGGVTPPASNATPAGTYPLTVTATNGTASRSVTLTLIVN